MTDFALMQRRNMTLETLSREKQGMSESLETKQTYSWQNRLQPESVLSDVRGQTSAKNIRGSERTSSLLFLPNGL